MTLALSQSWGFLPPIDPLIAAFVVLALLALSVRDLRRGITLAVAARFALRASAAACLGVIFAGPGRWIIPFFPDEPELAVLIDCSRSMSLIDAETGCTRLESMKRGWLSADAIAYLDVASELSLVAVDEHAETISYADADSLSPEGGQSHIVNAMTGVVARAQRSRQPRPTHVLLLSDAADTEGRTLASLALDAKSSGVRMHAVLPTGATGPGAAHVEAAFDRAWVRNEEHVTLHVDISECGPDGIRTRLSIRESGPDGPIVAEQLVTIGSRQRIDLDMTPRTDVLPGGIALARYFIRLDSLPDGRGSDGEANASIQVVGRGLRVVIFESDPSWDTRFFADALAAEPDIEVTTVYSLDDLFRGMGGPPASARLRVTRIVPGLGAITRTIGAPPPNAPESLEAFDLFVLGRNVASMLPAETLAHVRVLIEDRGRGALFLRGPGESGPFAWASPFVGEFAERTIDAPQIEINPALARDAPAIDVSSLQVVTGTLAPAASVFASANGEPLIVDSRAGTGRIGTVLADGLWRASLSHEESSADVRRLWVALAHRLVSGGEVPPGAAASLALDRTHCAPGESVRVLIRARDARADLANARLRVTKSDGSVEERALSRDPGGAPGKWGTIISPALAGDYSLWLELPPGPDGSTGPVLESMLTVRVRDIEMRDTTPRRADAETAAAATSGRVWPIDALDEFVELLKRETIAREGTPRFEPIWDSPWVFALIVLLLSVEWWWRRKGGLP